MKINPFLLSGYLGKDFFCDREKELSLLHEHLSNGRNTVLHAWRRLGKTSLIKRLEEDLESSGKWDCIYVDLLGTRNTEDAIKSLIRGVYQKYGKNSVSFLRSFLQLMGGLGISLKFDPISGSPELEAGFSPRHPVDESLNEIGNFLVKKKKNILLIMDEFQQMTKYDTQGIAEAQFRTFMQDFPQIRFLYSGSERNTIGTMFLSPKRPFYKGSTLMGLEPIPKEQYFPFIRNHFENDAQHIDNDILESMYAWSRGQTYCMQHLCNRMYASPGENSLEKLKKIQDQILNEESPVFSNYANLLTITQWQVLKAIAHAEPLKNHQSKAFLQQFQLGASSSVATAIKSLTEKEIVIKTQEAYLIHDVQLARWLQRLD